MKKTLLFATLMLGSIILTGCGAKKTNLPLITPMTGAVSTAPTDVKYDNMKYGFSIIFPQSRKGVIVQEKARSGNTSTGNHALSFGLSGMPSIFIVGVHPLGEWKSIQKSDEGKDLQKIGENKTYIFSITIPVRSGTGNSGASINNDEIHKILSTFRAITQ